MSAVIDAAAERLRWLADTSPDAWRLARLASIAVRIEPNLLRRLRTELLREADVGVEADLWFSAIVESQAVGIPVGEACVKLFERMPLAECNFFGIVISIQQKSGGNLSEALGNLSKVLRERKKMKAKIKAMSMEAKASASIIGSLPIIVGMLVYFTSPQYIEMLWTHPTGRMLLAGCAIWMMMGIMVMRKMINFDF